MDKLINLINGPFDADWGDRARDAFDELFGGSKGRYRSHAKDNIVRYKADSRPKSKAPFAALIHPSNPDSGGYGGMSFVLFPCSEGGGSLITLTLGTQGLSPDEQILARPGHARKASAIARWLNGRAGEQIAWSKNDPVRFDRSVPELVRREFPSWSQAFERYGNEIYLLVRPTDNDELLRDSVGAILDLMLEERNEQPLAKSEEHCKEIRDGYLSELLPNVDAQKVGRLLDERRFVILEGPPGTGKTRIAMQLIKDRYNGFGESVQFHPNTTYEHVVGGLSPVESDAGFGFRFEATPGHLMRCARKARSNPSQQFLLHIDEINRADLSKVLGEGIFLLEYRSDEPRQIELPYDFGEPFGRTFHLPSNLHILGTMNSSDRSIAILDLAVRRRFAFVKVWPQQSVVEEHGQPVSQRAYKELLRVFLEFATDDGFYLMPGHSYFMASTKEDAQARLLTELKPLLEEYVRHGYVAGFADEIRSYVQMLEGMFDDN